MGANSGTVAASVDRQATAFDYTLLGFVSFLWGGGVIASKLVAMGFPAFTAAGIRTGIASLVFLPLIFYSDRSFPKLSRSDLLKFLGLGACGYTAYTSLYFWGMRFTTASHGALMNGMVPIVTAILAALLIGERLGPVKTGGVIITTAGGALIVFTSASGLGGDATVLGDMIMLGAAASWSLYTIYTKPLMRQFSPTTVTGVSCFFGTAMLIPLALLTDFSSSSLQSASSTSWGALLYTALGSMAIAYILWNYGVKRIGATRTAVFGNIAPIWALVLTMPIMGEQLGIFHLIAAVLVLGGVWLVNKS